MAWLILCYNNRIDDPPNTSSKNLSSSTRFNDLAKMKSVEIYPWASLTTA
ncbi:hypothetical protein [Infirmifilum sp.]